MSLVACRLPGYADLFKEAAELERCEGIVLKHRDSRYVGSRERCVDNPRWLKIKHRAAWELR